MRRCAALKPVAHLLLQAREPKSTASVQFSFSNDVLRLADSQHRAFSSEVVANSSGKRISHPAFAVLVEHDESVLVTSVRERDRYSPHVAVCRANEWCLSSRPGVEIADDPDFLS